MSQVKVEEIGVFEKVNPCTDHLGRRRKQVGTRYVVIVNICEGMVSDGMWVRLTHAAKFVDAAKAEQLADKVRAALRAVPFWEPLTALNLAHWTWHHGQTNAFTSLQVPSTAVPYEVA